MKIHGFAKQVAHKAKWLGLVAWMVTFGVAASQIVMHTVTTAESHQAKQSRTNAPEKGRVAKATNSRGTDKVGAGRVGARRDTYKFPPVCTTIYTTQEAPESGTWMTGGPVYEQVATTVVCPQPKSFFEKGGKGTKIEVVKNGKAETSHEGTSMIPTSVEPAGQK